MSNPPLAALSAWLAAAGQTLFQTPSFGDAGWPGQEAWVLPAERLAVRYQLGPVVTTGAAPALGIVASTTRPEELLVGEPYRRAAPSVLLARLDPAPGIDASSLPSRGAGAAAEAVAAEAIRRIVATPEYQLA